MSCEIIPVTSPQAFSIDIMGGYDCPSESSAGKVTVDFIDDSAAPVNRGSYMSGHFIQIYKTSLRRVSYISYEMATSVKV